MKRKLLLATALVASALGMRAQTDVPFLLEKGNFDGSEVSSLSTFVPNGTTYTLELTGCTAGSEITVPGGSFSYTPESSGTVRFVRIDDNVYVYEGTSYKGTVAVSTPAAPTFPTGLTSSSTENLIQNGGFEDTSDGTYPNQKTHWKPTHWNSYNNSKTASGDGTSVRNGNPTLTGTYNMLMHNDGYYLTQQLKSGIMKNFTPYQISYNYRANETGQAGAKYKFQVGSEEFKTDYFNSDDNQKGTTTVQTFTATFTTPATIVDQPWIQLYRTGYVQNNNNQDLDRFDEFVLVAANGGGIGITGATGATFLSGSAYAPDGAFSASTSYSLASTYPTNLVKNGTFDSNVNGWTTTTGASNSKIANNQAGTFTGNFWENWNGDAYDGKMYQSVADIPNGTYKLNICAFVNKVDGEKGQYVYANDNKTYIYTTTPTAYTVYTYVTDNKLEYGLNQTTEVANWMGIDNVSLEYCGASDVTADGFNSIYKAATNHLTDPDYSIVTGEERTALQTAIDATPTATADGYAEATFNIGYADYTLMSAKANYETLAAAKNATYTELAYASAAKKTALDNAKASTATSAADADMKTAAITTALRAYYESHAMAEGVADAIDYTSAVSDANADPNKGWTKGIGTDSGKGYTDAEGNVASKYLNGGWSENAGVNIDMTREVAIPAGKYLLTVTARGETALETYTLSIGGETINLPHANSGSGGVFGNGWEDASIEFESAGTPLTLEIIAKSTASKQWISINRFRLVQLELYKDVYAGEAEYAALNNAISAAEANTLGFENGEYAPYNNQEAIKILAAAKAIDQTAELTNLKEDVKNVTTELINATWIVNTEEVNAIYNGDWAASTPNTETGVNVDVPGWTPVGGMRLLVGDKTTDPGLEYTTAGKALFSWGGTTITYGEQAGYTVPLKANTAYALTYKITAWRDGDYPTWASLTVDGATVSGDNKITVPGKINGSEGNPFKELAFYFVTGEAKDYVIKMYANKHFAISDLSLVKAPAIAINEGVDYTPANAAGTVTLTRKLTAGTWNSFVVPFNISNEELKAAFGDDVAVAEYSEEADGLNSTISFNTMDTPEIKANTPVLLKPTKTADSYEFVKNTVAGEAKVAGTNFDFVGTYAASGTVAAGDYFISGDKLYKSAGSTTIKGTRAYLKAKSAEAKARLVFDNGTATSIEAIEMAADKLTDGNVYDLSGRLVKTPVKGLYIKNGKKILVK